MFRKLQKKYILPRKWAKTRRNTINNTVYRDPEEVYEHIKERELEYHKQARMRQTTEANKLEGYLEALKWVCLEQNESKQ